MPRSCRLYEGTNGIQSMDLMDRKMTIRDGGPFKAFQAEVDRFCEKHREHPGLGDKVRLLAAVSARLWETAEEMKHRMKADPLQWASYTYPALVAFGEITMTWRLLEMAVIAHPASRKNGKESDFYKGKVMQATFFADMILPHTQATIETCCRQGREIVEIPDSAF